MFTDTGNTIPIIFLITDGSVEDERHICEVVKAQLINRRKICPRIYTFGIGILLSFVDVYLSLILIFKCRTLRGVVEFPFSDP